MPHPEREHSLQIEVARLRKLHEDTEDARCVLLAELCAANARADAAEANRDHWRSGYIEAAVTGRFPISPHDNDPEIRSLREAAEASFHGQAYAEMAKRARVAEEALAAARRECEGLRAILREEMERQHYVAAPGPESEDVDLCGGCGNAWPCEDADCFVFKARALLAAPASAAGEEKS